MFFVIVHLLGPSTQSLINCQLHGSRDGISIHDDLTVYVSRSSSRCLGQTSVTTEETLFVCVENRYQRYFWQVQTLSEQIDSHENIVDALTEVGKDLHSVECRHVTVDKGRLYPMVQKVFAEFLCHTFGKGGHKDSFTTMTTRQDLIHQVVDLVLAFADFNLRIQQSCRTDHLLNDHTFCLCQFEIGRGGTDVDYLINLFLELFKSQGTVVEGSRQTETIFHEITLTASVASIHRIDLWHRHMTLVDEEQIVIREEVEQAIRSFASLSPIEVATVVLDA